MTIKEYKTAKQIVKDYKVCGNGWCGCGKVFKTKDVTRTIYYGQVYYWCNKCYSKDD